MKKIYIEATWKIHSLVKELQSFPPEGYEFIAPESLQNRIINPFTKMHIVRLIYDQVGRVVPTNLFKPYLERYTKIPDDTDLTYSIAHLVFRKGPWILDLDSEPAIVLAGRVKHLKRYKKFIEKALTSEYCKKILCQVNAVKKSLLSSLDCRDFENKIEVVPYVVSKKDLTKEFNNNKVKLLFVNSANVPGSFEIKGGCEALEAFAHLRRRYNNLEMVVRSDIPEVIRAKYTGIQGLHIIDQIKSWAELEQEFKTSDIFILPAHVTPAIVFLDAMSYELPIITLDAWGNSEIVIEGITGFLIKKSDLDPYYGENGLPRWGELGINKKLRKTDQNVVNGLIEKMGILIENSELRRRMGKAGRWEIEHGKFSIRNRNEKLKRIFDEAMS
jgi:glycosyltransferase involved in cell wall biosynthesis